MKIDSFLQLFVVKERKFFPLFKQQGKYLLEAAGLLSKMVNESGEEKQKLLYREIKIIETKGDDVAGTIYNELHRSFVTPFERDDIQRLTSRVDSFLDLINDTGKRIVMYQPVPLTEHIKQMVDLVVQDARLLDELLDNLESIRKNTGKILEICKRVKIIEHECDDLYELSTVDLFGHVKDPVMLMKQREVVMTLEEITDRAQDIANIINRIIVKFA